MTTDVNRVHYMTLLAAASEKTFAANAILQGAMHVGLTAKSSTTLLECLRGANAATQELNNMLLGHEKPKEG